MRTALRPAKNESTSRKQHTALKQHDVDVLSRSSLHSRNTQVSRHKRHSGVPNERSRSSARTSVSSRFSLIATQHMTTPLWAMGLMAFCTLLLTTGQLLMKYSVVQGIGTTQSTVILLIGLCVYVVAGLLVTFALKHGELSVLYPIIALGFIWVSLASVYFLGETLPVHQIAGTAAIIIGISLIGHVGRGRRKNTLLRTTAVSVDRLVKKNGSKRKNARYRAHRGNE